MAKREHEEKIGKMSGSGGADALKGMSLPKEASERPPGEKSHSGSAGKSMGSNAGIPDEQGGKMYHEIVNDKMSKKLVGC